MKRTPSPYFTPCKEIWMSFYRQRNNIDYYFTGVDGKALTELFKKIIHQLQARSMEPSIENVTNSFKMFLESIIDRWHLENLQLKNINSNWNSLYAKAAKSSPLGVRDSVEEYLRNKNSQRAG